MEEMAGPPEAQTIKGGGETYSQIPRAWQMRQNMEFEGQFRGMSAAGGRHGSREGYMSPPWMIWALTLREGQQWLI